jgi:hypothetical protein
LALDPSQRPPTPGSLATALERCGHAIASHAQVAAFVNELAGPQLGRDAPVARLALEHATGAEEAQLTAALPPGAQAPEAPAPTPASRTASVAPPAQPAPGARAGTALPSGLGSRSLAAALALAMERRRASGEFPAFKPASGHAGPRAPSLENLATPQRARGAPPPRQGLPPAQVILPLPVLHHEHPADAFADEEKTTVHRAVRDPGGVVGYTTPSAPVRLGPKRALLAAMASVVLLLQLWMLGLVRSHREGSRSASPAESELSSEAPER